MSDVHIHLTALVETEDIGAGTTIWAYAHIMRGAQIGKHCNIGDHCFIESGVVVGDNVTIKNGSLLWEGVTLREGVFVGPGVCFTNDLRPRSPRLALAQARYSNRNWLAPTLVEQGATLGAGAVILAGVTIGAYAMVAAGAVVTKGVPAYALVKGNPARVSGWVCRCGQSLEFDGDRAVCADCGSHYQLRNQAVEPI